jgi:hypothetical protein
MNLQIDDAFIRQWEPEYDRTESDEDAYKTLVALVAEEFGSTGTISMQTFLAIWSWKGATRVIRHVRLDDYDSLYAPAFRRAASEPTGRKLAALLGPGVKLPGVEAATGSTLLHFIHPHSMPIIDVRTVEVLFEAGLISTKQRNLAHYEEFRQAVAGIRSRCPTWSLRQIDRALFAYHKQVLDKDGQGGKCSMTSPLAHSRDSYSPLRPQRAATTNHDRFASVFKNRLGKTFSTSDIVKIMLAESDIQGGSILPNDHGEGNKGQCPCVGTDHQIFDRVGRGIYRVRQYRS